MKHGQPSRREPSERHALTRLCLCPRLCMIYDVLALMLICPEFLTLHEYFQE